MDGDLLMITQLMAKEMVYITEDGKRVYVGIPRDVDGFKQGVHIFVGANLSLFGDVDQNKLEAVVARMADIRGREISSDIGFWVYESRQTGDEK
ncbi:MAG: hypothetical protein AABX33_07595 [Nanoarchaeota archaeon]